MSRGNGTVVEIEVSQLSQTYESGSAAVNELSFTVKKGEFFIIMGPSGSGKTTLLKCIAGLLIPDSGKIFLDKLDITPLPPHKRNVSLIFQDFALFPHMTVFENIAFGLKLKKVSRAEIEREVKEILELIGLPNVAQRFPRQLSGGEKQRVAIARSLVVKPKVLLFDEPLANLDYRLQRKMEEELKELHRKLGLTFIYVTHNQEQALSLGDRVMLINKGVIEQIGSPMEIYMHPRNVFTARFLGEINLIRGRVTRKTEKSVEVKTAAGTYTGRCWDEGLEVGGEVTYAVRPEKVSLSPDGKDRVNFVRGRFINVIYRGTEAECISELADGTRFKAILPGDHLGTMELKRSDEIILEWDAEDAFVLKKVSEVGGIDIESLMYGR